MVSSHGGTGRCTRLKRWEGQTRWFWARLRHWDRLESWLGQLGWEMGSTQSASEVWMYPKNNQLLPNVSVNMAVAEPLVLPASCTRGVLVVDTGETLARRAPRLWHIEAA